MVRLHRGRAASVTFSPHTFLVWMLHDAAGTSRGLLRKSAIYVANVHRCNCLAFLPAKGGERPVSATFDDIRRPSLPATFRSGHAPDTSFLRIPHLLPSAFCSLVNIWFDSYRRNVVRSAFYRQDGCCRFGATRKLRRPLPRRAAGRAAPCLCWRRIHLTK